jgi:predicted metalloprotease with PDZ domain
MAGVEYRVDDSYGSPVPGREVSPEAGSSLDRDDAFLNPHMVCGFFRGFQSAPLALSFEYASRWTIATALQGANGTYHADSFDQLVDSPMMFGDLSHAVFTAGGMEVDVYTRSEEGLLPAGVIADTLRRVVLAAQHFVGIIPAQRYMFLFYFRPGIGYAALEHRTSSFYTIPEADWPATMRRVMDTAPHEFLHVVTPLSLRSEVIDTFDFETPVASAHLWFYEGVTEWGSVMMRVRGNIMTEQALIDVIREKLADLELYDQNVSLLESSLGCYETTETSWPNAYARGMLIALMLDLRLYELSGGTMGLSDLLEVLSREFGVRRPFIDREFFEVLIRDTFPGMRDFFSRYVGGIQPLPIEEYLRRVGYEYFPRLETGRVIGSIGRWRYSYENSEFVVREPDTADSVTSRLGIRDGDTLVALRYGENEVVPGGGRVDEARKSIVPGESFTWVVKRNIMEFRLTAVAGSEEVVEEHAIFPVKDLTAEERACRAWWLTNH